MGHTRGVDMYQTVEEWMNIFQTCKNDLVSIIYVLMEYQQ